MTGGAIARQAIVDRERRVVAYELLFRGSPGPHRGAEGRAASASVAAGALPALTTGPGLDDKLAFVNMGATALMSDVPAMLPPDRVVIEILEHVDVTPALVSRVGALRAAGFRFALDDYDGGAATRPLLPLVSYVKLDVLALPASRLAAVAEAVLRHPVQLVAEKVETRASYDACLGLPFDLFQGYYLGRPEALHP